MNTDHCRLERDGHVLVVTLNRPEAENAQSSGMLAGMCRAWRMLDADRELRVAAEDAIFGVTEARRGLFPLGGSSVRPRRQIPYTIAAEICDNAPLSVRALVRMLREIDESYPEADALVKELEIGGPIFATKDAREGPRAFAEKRNPVYTGQ